MLDDPGDAEYRILYPGSKNPYPDTMNISLGKGLLYIYKLRKIGLMSLPWRKHSNRINDSKLPFMSAEAHTRSIKLSKY
jgi:hypothetical protein